MEFIHLTPTPRLWDTKGKPELQGQTPTERGVASLPVTGNLAVWAKPHATATPGPLSPCVGDNLGEGGVLCEQEAASVLCPPRLRPLGSLA